MPPRVIRALQSRLVITFITTVDMAGALILIGVVSCMLTGFSDAVPYQYLTPFTDYYGNIGGGNPGPPYGGYGLGEWFPWYPIGYGGYGYDRSYAIRAEVPSGVYGFDGCGCDGYGKYGCNC